MAVSSAKITGPINIQVTLPDKTVAIFDGDFIEFEVSIDQQEDGERLFYGPMFPKKIDDPGYVVTHREFRLKIDGNCPYLVVTLDETNKEGS